MKQIFYDMEVTSILSNFSFSEPIESLQIWISMASLRYYMCAH